MAKFIDLTGQVFGRLTVIERSKNSKSGKAKWICRCSCDNEVVVFSINLIKKTTQSCGCFHKDKITTHGLSKQRIFREWVDMRSRCKTRKKGFKHLYFDKGIIVCDEWDKNLLPFYEWAIKNGYSDDLTLDRIDGDGNYEPSNCRWVTQKEQTRNTTQNVIYKGEYATDATKRLKSNISLIHQRLKRGMSLHDAFNTPVRKKKRK